MRSYLKGSADLREKGFAPAPPQGGFSRNRRLRGYDPDAVDRHVAQLVGEAAAAGLRVLPAIPFSTKNAHRASWRQASRAGWRQYERDTHAGWRRVSDQPGARLNLTTSKLRNACTIIGTSGEVLLTRRGRTIMLATGQVLRLDPGQLTDRATSEPVLWMRGGNFGGEAAGHVLFPGQRYLVFPVSGSRLRNAVMTAVSESDTTVLWFRRIPKGIIEVVAHPDFHLTTEVL